jgi:hypothetical protein
MRVLLVALLLLVLAACGDSGSALPAISMTSGGGFEATSQEWTIAPDGAWTWNRVDKIDGLRAWLPRSGRLTGAAFDEVRRLATDPDLVREMHLPHERCTWSDGSDERLDVGSNHYLAGWCDGTRKHIGRLRERIVALTTGTVN